MRPHQTGAPTPCPDEAVKEGTADAGPQRSRISASCVITRRAWPERATLRATRRPTRCRTAQAVANTGSSGIRPKITAAHPCRDAHNAPFRGAARMSQRSAQRAGRHARSQVRTTAGGAASRRSSASVSIGGVGAICIAALAPKHQHRSDARNDASNFRPGGLHEHILSLHRPDDARVADQSKRREHRISLQ